MNWVSATLAEGDVPRIVHDIRESEHQLLSTIVPRRIAAGQDGFNC